jgi:hypothetical protein
VIIGDAGLAARIAERLLEKGIYVIVFPYPVVPKHKGRTCMQLSAAHTRSDLKIAVRGAEAKREIGFYFRAFSILESSIGHRMCIGGPVARSIPVRRRPYSTYRHASH